MSFQEGFTGASFNAEALAKLRTELELVQQDLLPRNTYKEAKMLKQELSNNMAKIQNLMAVMQKLETESNDIWKRLEETEAERDLAFNQMGQEQASETNQEDADQWIIDIVMREAAIKPIIDTNTTEIVATKTLGDPAQFQAMMMDKLGQHFTSVIRAATIRMAQQTDAKRTKRCGLLEPKCSDHRFGMTRSSMYRNVTHNCYCSCLRMMLSFFF